MLEDSLIELTFHLMLQKLHFIMYISLANFVYFANSILIIVVLYTLLFTFCNMMNQMNFAKQIRACLYTELVLTMHCNMLVFVSYTPSGKKKELY